MSGDAGPPAAERLHAESLVLDLHAHGPGFVPQPFRTAWDVVTCTGPAECELATGTDAVVAAAVGDPVVTRCYLGRGAWDAVEAQLARVERQTRSAGATIALTADDLVRAQAAGRAAVLLGVEGADALGADVDNVDRWHERGIRLVGLVHLGDNQLGSTCLPWRQYVRRSPRSPRTGAGLSPIGRRVVARMNRVGIVVDVAHADSTTLFDVVDAATAPVVSSHSGARALQDFPRYLTDDELRAVAATGGVVGLWPYRSRHHGVRDLSALAAHARHIADTVGPEHLALGTDTNGIPAAACDYQGPRDLPKLTGALLAVGFDDDEVAGILGINALRVLRQVEQHAHQPPS